MQKGTRNPEMTRRKLVESTVGLVLRQGFAATTVDQICAAAGLTKGSFFHHFENKRAIGRAAIESWSAMGTDLYSAAWTDPEADPLDQLHAVLGIMSGFASRPNQPCVCVIGMMSQELAGSHPEMRDLCGRELGVWTSHVAGLLAAAKSRHPVVRDFDPDQVGWFLNSLWQGSMLIAKTREDPQIIVENLRHARAYIDGLFDLSSTK